PISWFALFPLQIHALHRQQSLRGSVSPVPAARILHLAAPRASGGGRRLCNDHWSPFPDIRRTGFGGAFRARHQHTDGRRSLSIWIASIVLSDHFFFPPFF